jgi:diphosphomevalonate decarboxylase
MWTATACANSNLALVKYWGNVNDRLRLPANGSISMNLAGLQTRTRTSFSPDLKADTVIVDGVAVTGNSLQRIERHLDFIRKLAAVDYGADVLSISNFPSSAGIASSASAFAALSLAATTALGLNLSERALSCLARLGSGSASRSVPGGFAEWYPGTTHEASFAETFAPASHWGLTDLVAVVDSVPKRVGSTEGHALAASSVLQHSRVDSAPDRLVRCRDSIMQRDFPGLAKVVELDSNLMHAVMMTSSPPLFYWRRETLAIMEAVREWRADGVEVLYTVDAGANVHCVCAPGHADEVQTRLSMRPNIIEVLRATPGEAAHICNEE